MMTDTIPLVISGTVNGLLDPLIGQELELDYTHEDVIVLIPNIGDYKLPVNYAWDDQHDNYHDIDHDINHNNDFDYVHQYDSTNGIISPTLSDMYRITATDNLNNQTTRHVKINISVGIKMIRSSHDLNKKINVLTNNEHISLDTGGASFTAYGLGGSGLYIHNWYDLPEGINNPGNIDTLTMINPKIGTYSVEIIDAIQKDNSAKFTFTVTEINANLNIDDIALVQKLNVNPKINANPDIKIKCKSIPSVGQLLIRTLGYGDEFIIYEDDTNQLEACIDDGNNDDLYIYRWIFANTIVSASKVCLVSISGQYVLIITDLTGAQTECNINVRVMNRIKSHTILLIDSLGAPCGSSISIYDNKVNISANFNIEDKLLLHNHDCNVCISSQVVPDIKNVEYTLIVNNIIMSIGIANLYDGNGMIDFGDVWLNSFPAIILLRIAIPNGPIIDTCYCTIQKKSRKYL